MRDFKGEVRRVLNSDNILMLGIAGCQEWWTKTWNSGRFTVDLGSRFVLGSPLRASKSAPEQRA
jgi:hypothetical protein